MVLNCTIIVGQFLYVEKGMEHLEELSDKEEDFIDRAVNPRLNSRLGCQCVLQDGGGTIEITLPDQTQFLGE
jgi:2Fe-2S ferredoxin